ncbi:MAG: hypothetical protein K0B02_05155 [DPANN group archaeon]|nr:hypothetical protein [DPANN group archaeon]
MSDEWKEVILKTGVDSLLSLVIEEGQISVKDASRRLNKNPEILEAWADALNSENLITTLYDSTGDLVLKATKKNIDAKKSKIKLLKESSTEEISNLQKYLNTKETDINLAQEHINDFESILNKDLLKINNFQEELKNFKKKQDDIESRIFKIDKEENLLKMSEAMLENKEKKLRDESNKIINIVSVKHDLIKKTKDELSKIQNLKDALKVDLHVIMKLSSIIDEKHPKDLEKQVKEIEKKGEELKKKHNIIETKFGIFTRLISKLYS